MNARAWVIGGVALVGLLVFARRARASSTVASGAPSEAIGRFASAIAQAEGFGVPGAIPTRANNPGDLKLGPPALNGITIFESASAGWRALYEQLLRIRDNRSAFYRREMSIADMAELYAGPGGAQDWASNVARELGVPQSSAIGGLL